MIVNGSPNLYVDVDLTGLRPYVTLMKRSILHTLTLVLVIAGCGPNDASPEPRRTAAPEATELTEPTKVAVPLPGSATTWSEPADYTFVMESYCGERNLIGRFRVHVEDHSTVEIERLDQAAQAFSGTAEEVPTLGALVARATEARIAGADTVTVNMDPVDRHPTEIKVDWRAQAIDDEECYAISEYVPG